MKICPQCRTAYTDDSLRFCLQDGTPLVEKVEENADQPTVAFDDLETVVSRKPPQQVVPLDTPETESDYRRQTQNWQPTEEQTIAVLPNDAKKSNTALTVLATALVMLLIFGVAGAYFLLKSRNHEVASVNVNALPNRPINSNLTGGQTINTNLSTPAPPTPAPSPTAPPLPKPTLEPKAVKAAVKDVENAIDDWKDSSENLDLDGNLTQYADTVDYYNAGRVSRERVRADKQRAFDQYDSIKFKISNVKITSDATGEKASAIFDKEWNFEGAEKYSSGKVQQQLTFGKINGQWLIIGEKDLRTYYVEK